ncbi:hypothetical protein SUGI_0219980 [Cryptomeria japonica]|nr:hypothetical protein SUGI_0219980 [Cryptomeria japonica]
MEDLNGDSMTSPELKSISEASDEMAITPLSASEQKPSDLEEGKARIEGMRVRGGERGEGLPYAPEGWPNPEDKWGWGVGKRRSTKGYFTDRFLTLPKRLQQGTTFICLRSRVAVENYMRETFPEVDLKIFFDSFQWQVPCSAPWTFEGFGLQTRSKRKLREGSDNCERNPVKSAGKEVAGLLDFPCPISMDFEGKGKEIDFKRLQSLPSDRRAIVVENEVYLALERLKDSQQRQYEMLRQKLFSQKQFIYRDLDSNGAAEKQGIFQTMPDIAGEFGDRG